MRDLEAFEREARQDKCGQIFAAQALDDGRMADIAQIDLDRQVRTIEAMELLEAFRSSGDGEAFAAGMEQWCRRPGFNAFVGPSGQMFLKQLVKAGEQGEGAEILRDVLFAPVNDAQAQAALQRVLDFIDKVKQGGHPAPARTPYLLSFFWGMQEPQQWPVAWPSATKCLYLLGWIDPGHDHAANYLDFAGVMRSLGADLVQLGHAFAWFEKHRFVGLAPSLVERCKVAWDLADEGRITSYPTESVRRDAGKNSLALTYELWINLSGLRDDLAEIMGRPGKLQFSKIKSGDHLYRWWGWSSCTPEGSNASFRLWATRDGVFAGLHPGRARPGWIKEVAPLVSEALPTGYEIFEVRDDDPGRLKPLGTANPEYEFLVGRFFPGETALGRKDFGDEVLGVAADLQPLLDRLLVAARAPSKGGGPITITEPVPAVPSGELAPLVEEFKRDRPYPTPKDDQSRAQRDEWSERLSPEELQIADLNVLRQIINTGRYGSAGPQSILNSTLGSLDASGIEHFYETISELLWSEEDLAVRIDRALDPDHGYKGLGESVIMKLLSIAHPERVVPVFPFNGDMGKAKLMQMIGLAPPPSDHTRGQKQVESNDAIREALEPYFPKDPWAQGQFLYWFRTRPEPHDDGGDEGDALRALAEELFIPVEDLEDWVSLLKEKRQVIFYGPPGTGKTYVARQMAELVAGDAGRCRLVQFHPSTSYEDFFEGYRPETSPEGTLGYRLVPGPLARLAAEAENAPGVDHVMVIDEINRANLPKVFGELLFLLEYRNEQVNTLYRAEDAFELPGNLLFIGTMNTADKSIALIDAALRRRFHFIPFFPHEEPHSSVLAKWLGEHNSDALWVAGLLEHVNARLIDLLGGPHLQIGPSYFFDEKLDEDKVRRIWRYSILPFIEDQLWGQTELLRTFEFDQVLKDYRSAGGESPAEEPASDAPDDSETSEGDDSAP